MPYAPHVRCTALGRLSTSGERFAYGLNVARGDSIAQAVFGNVFAENQTVFDDLAEDFRSFHATAAARIASAAVLEEVKFAQIGPDGKYTDDPVIVNVADTPGGQAGGPVPESMVLPQSALVVSLGTARRGPTGKGRFYLPMPVIDLSPDLLMPVSNRDPVEAAAATFINNINEQPGLDVLNIRVVVASSKGYNTVVNSVRVGRAIDTMRSRRASIDEAYGVPTAITA